MNHQGFDALLMTFRHDFTPLARKYGWPAGSIRMCQFTLAVLCHFAGPSGRTKWRPISQIARAINSSPRSVEMALKRLEQAQLVDITRRLKRPNYYRIRPEVLANLPLLDEPRDAPQPLRDEPQPLRHDPQPLRDQPQPLRSYGVLGVLGVDGEPAALERKAAQRIATPHQARPGWRRAPLRARTDISGPMAFAAAKAPR